MLSSKFYLFFFITRYQGINFKITQKVKKLKTNGLRSNIQNHIIYSSTDRTKHHLALIIDTFEHPISRLSYTYFLYKKTIFQPPKKKKIKTKSIFLKAFETFNHTRSS